MGKEIMSRLLVMCLCFLALAASKGANGEGNDDEAITRGNTYIDKLLSDMFDDNDDYDPYEMEDSVVGFNKKIVFVNVSGEAKLHDGTIKGLRTLHRPRDCSLHEEGEKLKVKADLGAGILNFHYSGSAKFMNFGPTITVNGELAYIEVHMEFTVDGKTGRQGKLTKFEIDEIRGMKVWVTGLGPINWAVNPIVSGVTKIFQRFVRRFLENKVQKYIAERLPNYQFPIEGGSETEAPLTEPTSPDTPAPEETTQPPEPETPAPEETTQPPEPETPAPEETTQPPEPETPAPEETTQPPEPETPAPEETTQPPEPETPVPEETTLPPEPETTVPEEPEPEEPEEPEPEEPEEPEPEEPVEPMK